MKAANFPHRDAEKTSVVGHADEALTDVAADGVVDRQADHAADGHRDQHQQWAARTANRIRAAEQHDGVAGKRRHHVLDQRRQREHEVPELTQTVCPCVELLHHSKATLR